MGSCLVRKFTITNSTVRQALAEFFLSSARAIARRLKRNGYPLTISERRAQPLRFHDGWIISESDSLVNILASNYPWPQRGSPQLTPQEIRKASHLGNAIADSCVGTLPFWPASTFGSELLAPTKDGKTPAAPDFGIDPARWVARYIVLPALQSHLVALSSLDRADSASALAFADEVIRVAHDDRWHFREIALIGGIDLESVEYGAFGQAQVTFRRATEQEQVQWLKKTSFTRMFEEEDPPTVALEVRCDAPRTLDEPKWHDATPILVSALQLEGHKVTGSVATETVQPDWLLQLISLNELNLPLTSRRRIEELTRNDIPAIFKTASMIRDFNVVEPRSVRDLALHRFVSGCARQIPADALIDFTITLESLLLPYDENARRGDLSYRFRIHGAHYLAIDISDRNEIFQQLRNIYDTRSRLVHGAKYPSEAETIATCDAAYNLARCGLLRAVYHGFPTPQMLQQMVLGSN